MNPRLQTACASRRHCRSCRTDPEQRRQVGFPDECPEHFTAEDLPEVGLLTWPDARRVALADLGDERLAICNDCDGRDDCDLWRRKPCYVRRVLKRPLMCCPAETPRWLPAVTAEPV